mmetsp:Transcript_27063/g.23913  ORF Transcript_27063/g.23913 Transcript_27063/m.23913 type:complete len:155 (+) Transcript_27063:886-1350(+)
MNEFQVNQPGFKIYIPSTYLYFQSRDKSYVIKVDKLSLGFGKNPRIVYADDDIYVFRNPYYLKMEGAEAVGDDSIFTNKFNEMLSSKPGLKKFTQYISELSKDITRENKGYKDYFFAIFNNRVHSLMINGLVDKIFPSFINLRKAHIASNDRIV